LLGLLLLDCFAPLAMTADKTVRSLADQNHGGWGRNATKALAMLL
jgi:hypothetical protein